MSMISKSFFEELTKSITSLSRSIGIAFEGQMRAANQPKIFSVTFGPYAL